MIETTSRQNRRIGVTGLILLAALVTAACVTGARAAEPAASGDWQLRVTPYVWAAALKGDVATIPGVPPAHVDASFSDILDQTDFALMLLMEASRGRYGVVADVDYLDLSAKGATPGPAFGSAKLSQKFLISTLAGTYEVFDDDRIHIDAAAGARIWYSDAKLSLSAGALPAVSSSESKTWVDPIVGLRFGAALSERFSFRAFADIGGFDVSSHRTWQAFGGLGYAFSDTLRGVAGYRHMKVDYKDGDFLYDVDLDGPILGLDITF